MLLVFSYLIFYYLSNFHATKGWVPFQSHNISRVNIFFAFILLGRNSSYFLSDLKRMGIEEIPEEECDHMCSPLPYSILMSRPFAQT